MTPSKVPHVMFGVAAGVAIGAALIGLALVGLATAIDLQADSASVLSQHPLFVSGTELVTTGFIAGLPLLAIWYLRGKR